MAGGAGVILGLALAVAMALAVVALLLRRRVRALEAQAAHAEAAERTRAEFYREILDTLPIPIWRRAQDLTLLFVNRAYAFAAGADSPAEALIAGKEIGADDAASLARRARNTGEALSESRATIVGEDRVLIEATERPLPTGGLVGDGRDVTALIAARTSRRASSRPMPKCWNGSARRSRSSRRRGIRPSSTPPSPNSSISSPRS